MHAAAFQVQNWCYPSKNIGHYTHDVILPLIAGTNLPFTWSYKDGNISSVNDDQCPCSSSASKVSRK